MFHIAFSAACRVLERERTITRAWNSIAKTIVARKKLSLYKVQLTARCNSTYGINRVILCVLYSTQQAKILKRRLEVGKKSVAVILSKHNHQFIIDFLSA